MPTYRKVYFFDDRFIDSQMGLTREMVRPEKFAENPILQPEQPWEGKCILIWGSVLWDPQDDLFKMWYQTHNPTFALPNRTLLCFAMSRDGIYWERPEFGLYEFEGSRQNNIVYKPAERFDSATVVLDPLASSPSSRFKMVLYDKQNHRLVRFTSPDGLRWREKGFIDKLGGVGDRHTVWLNPQTGQWMLLFKRLGGIRTTHMAVSDDFEHWENLGEVLSPTLDDPPETEFYGMVGFEENGYEIGFLEMFQILERRLHTELVLFDENHKPYRYQPSLAFLDHGCWGQWDSAWAFPGHCAPIRVGEELRIYYQGRPTLHWADPPNGTGHFGAIGLARLRAEGYVRLQGTGTLTTKPLEVTGQSLCINADATSGEIRVELLNEDGEVLQPYSAKNNTPLRCDATYYKQAWNRGSDLSELKGRRLQIRVHLTSSSIYSLWFGEIPGDHNAAKATPVT